MPRPILPGDTGGASRRMRPTARLRLVVGLLLALAAMAAGLLLRPMLQLQQQAADIAGLPGLAVTLRAELEALRSVASAQAPAPARAAATGADAVAARAAEAAARETVFEPTLEQALERARGATREFNDTLARIGPAGLPDAAAVQAALAIVADVRDALRQPQDGAPTIDTAIGGLRSAELRLRELAVAHRQTSRERLHVGLALALLGLAALLLGIGERVGRDLDRQHDRLARQTAEMQRLALVAERTSNGVAITDARGRIVWVNEAFVRLWGWSRPEAIGRRARDLLASELTDRDTLRRIAEAHRKGRGIHAEVLYRARSGQDRWVDVDIQPLHGADGALSGFIGVATDISSLVAERQRTQAMLSVLPAGVVVQGVDGAIVDCNPAAVAALGLDREQMLGRRSVDPDWRAVRDDLSPYPGDEHPPMRTLRSGMGLRSESMGIQTPAGDLRWLVVNTEPLRDARGAVDGVVSCFVDVTQQRREQRMLSLTLEYAGLGLWEWDLKSGAVRCNDRFTGMLGYRPGELPMTPQTWIDAVHPEDRDRWLGAIDAHLHDPEVPYRQELRLRRADGGWSSVTSTGAVIERSPHGTPRRMAGVHIDMTDHMQMQAMLVYASNTDGLTGLSNRAAMLRRVEAAIERHRAQPDWQFAVLYMDFDRFKQVNDSFGHATGDDLLSQIAQRLTGALRAGDAVSRPEGVADPAREHAAARIGGDEFVVLLEDVHGLAGAQAVADRLLALLAEPYLLRGTHRVHSTASIGIVCSEPGGNDGAPARLDADTVMRDADTAMYEAKRAGRGRYVVFHPSMHDRVARSASLEHDLRAGLQADQIYPVYQPIVDLSEPAGRVAVEALARWRHPQRGLVPPSEFIPVAEESGLIADLGDRILKAACCDFVRWQRELGARAPSSIAVNLSRAQLLDPALLDDVMRSIRDSGIDPACLQLEITESLAAQDACIQSALHALKALGVTLALDDFGTGYSSLACLHQLPVDTVKIDRSFVRDAQRSDYHRVLIEATVQVARSLGMKTVAEGVETAGQLELVRSLQCGKAQGYLFSRPLPGAELPAWIAARSGPACGGPGVTTAETTPVAA